jgi:hypothetical protein
MKIGGDGDAHTAIVGAWNGESRRLKNAAFAKRRQNPDSAGLFRPGCEHLKIVNEGVWRAEKNGPPAIPSLPNGPKVLFFSPKVEDIPT